MKTTYAVIALTFSFFATSVQAQPNFFYGGNIGLAFGDVDYVELSPMIGVQVTQELSTGVQFLYRNTDDSRNNQSIESTDIGTTLFARYHVAPTLFLEGNYEYIDREIDRNGVEESGTFSSFLAGGGISTPLGSAVRTTITVLYNFNYDEDDSPYSDPWSVRFGVGFNYH